MRQVAAAPDLSAAHRLCAALRERGIEAKPGTVPAAEGLPPDPVPILVPDDQEERAGAVLAELEREALAREIETQAAAASGAPPPAPDPDRASLRLELLAVVLLMGGWAILGELLRELGGLPEEAPWGTFETAAWYVLLLGQTVALLWLVRRWRGEPAAAFGWVRPRAQDLLEGMVVLVLLVFADLLMRRVVGVGWAGPSELPSLGRNLAEGVAAVVGVVAAAAAEELVWRGYAVPRLQRLTGSPVLAVLGSALLFGSMHLHYDAFGVLSTFVNGLVYALYFLAARRVGPLIVGHVLWNVFIAEWS